MPVTKSTTKKTPAKAAKTKKVASGDEWISMEELKKTVRETSINVEQLSDRLEKQIEKTQRQVDETSRVVKETSIAIGKLGGRLGDMAEHLLTPNLTEKFKKYGFNFSRMGSNVSMEDNENDIYAEIDAMLENGTQAMAVEVKVNLKTTDVDDHIERMKKIRKYADLRGNGRQFYGAVAGTVVNKAVELYAIRHGFYVIKPSGEDVTIVPPVSKNIFW